MRDACFYSAGTGHAMRSLQKPFDLEKELSSRGFPLASHGRIDWNRIPEKTIYQVADDNDAAHAIASMIQDRNLAGETVVVWSDAGVRPIILDAATISTYAVPICEEGWDCWLISVAGGWVIEKYHEGEVCFAPAPGVGPPITGAGMRPMMTAKDEVTSPRQTFHKALMLLDRGSAARGEALLRDVIGVAEARHDDVALVQSLVCLGELLCATGRADEARPFLERAVAIRRDDDGLAVEFERARALLSGRGRQARDA